MTMEHLSHIPRPWMRGTVYPYQTGYAYSIVGSDGKDYHIQLVPFRTVGDAYSAMETTVQQGRSA